MSLSGLPDAVIMRLRSEAAVFGNRVAGTSAMAECWEQTDFPVPHAFYVPGSIEADDVTISPLDQEMTVRFKIAVAVSNLSDERGQAAATGLMACTRPVVAALLGWVPGPGFSPVLWDGMEEDLNSNRARLWGALTFRTSTTTSNL